MEAIEGPDQLGLDLEAISNRRAAVRPLPRVHSTRYEYRLLPQHRRRCKSFPAMLDNFIS